MGEMSSIVSRRPSSRNHWNEAFWMSIRLGRSRTCLRRENVLRALGAATLLVKWNFLPWKCLLLRRSGEKGGREPFMIPNTPAPGQGQTAPPIRANDPVDGSIPEV